MTAKPGSDTDHHSTPAALRLQERGYAVVQLPLDNALLSELRASAVQPGEAGREERGHMIPTGRCATCGGHR